jgi:hypothetical protein
LRTLALVASVLAAGACGGEAEPPPQGSPAGETGPPPKAAGTVRQWVAVFDTAGHPDGLDPSTEELLDAVGGNVAVQPVQCWQGLAEDLEVGAGEYAAAVIGTSQQELDGLVDQVGEEPIGTGRYRAFCLD